MKPELLEHLVDLVDPSLAGWRPPIFGAFTFEDEHPDFFQVAAQRLDELRRAKANDGSVSTANLYCLPPSSSKQPRKQRERAPYVPTRIPTELEQRVAANKLRRLGLVATRKS